MCYTIIFNVNNCPSNSNVGNIKEWLKSATVIDGECTTMKTTFSLENYSIYSFLKELVNFVRQDVIIVPNFMKNILEQLFKIYLKKNLEIKEEIHSFTTLNPLIGAGSNNLELPSSNEIKIIDMRGWINKSNPADQRIYVRIDTGAGDGVYYIHKNGCRYPKNEFKELLSQYHLGGLLQKELIYTQSNSFEEMFQKLIQEKVRREEKRNISVA